MFHYEEARRRMVAEQLVSRGVRDPRVLEAMAEVPRHFFVDEPEREQAYDDCALPIGEQQTISQPYMVAYMTELLELQGRERVLEIGTGSGYQAAVLSRLAAEVFSIERIESLARRAEEVLGRLGYRNVSIRVGDGSLGWPEQAPFDGIIVTAGAPEIPRPLVEQLGPSGRLVIPVGDRRGQVLHRVRRTDAGVEDLALTSCIFVPLIGARGWRLEKDQPDGNGAPF